MKFFLIVFAVIAAVAADVSHLPSNEYLPPVQYDAVVPTNEYLPPVQNYGPVVAPAHELADDGYRYKTHRRVVYRRHRRDVSHLPSNEYLPPVQQQEAVVQVVPTADYLPPVQSPVAVEVTPAHELADDGYRYKTNRRVVYRRNRRDVSHLPLNEYLPPVQQQEAVPEVVPTEDYLPPVQSPAPVEAAPAHELADDGYRYKTQRRVVYRRNRRDVSHLSSSEYLPPAPEIVPVEVAPIQEVSNAVVEDAFPAHELADDGYRYKTHRRVVYRRNRRDVSHLPSNEYLPPGQEAGEPVELQVVVLDEAAPAHELADDGYRYKTQRRVVYRRNRRDVSHLPSNEYLPPVQQEVVPVVTPEYLPPVQQDEPAPAHELSSDGYRYKTHRRVVYRRH